MIRTRFLALGLLALSACKASREHASADSARAAAAEQHERLATELSAQKDSLTRIVLQADEFIMRIDSSVRTVKGLPKGKAQSERLDPLAQQIENRKEVLARVDALVKRARTTANQLASAQKENAELRVKAESDAQLVADLGTTIQRQQASIDGLQVRVDSLNGVTRDLEGRLTTLAAAHNKAYYVVGTEDELVKKGIVVREGGANLLVVRPGRTLQTARTLDPSAFTPVDQRETQQISLPDTTRRYAVVSRQSLDYAEVSEREKTSFRGNLKITKPDQFWASSRYLVLVAR
jgi:hypothetical protein